MLARTHFGITKLAYAAAFDAAAELGRHRLHAVADAEHRSALRPNGCRRARCVALRDAVWSAGKHDAARREGAYEIIAHIVGMDLAVDVQLAKTAGDQLRVLRTEVEDQYPAMRRGCHGSGRRSLSVTQRCSWGLP